MHVHKINAFIHINTILQQIHKYIDHTQQTQKQTQQTYETDIHNKRINANIHKHTQHTYGDLFLNGLRFFPLHLIWVREPLFQEFSFNHLQKYKGKKK